MAIKYQHFHNRNRVFCLQLIQFIQIALCHKLNFLRKIFPKEQALTRRLLRRSLRLASREWAQVNIYI